jgi:metal-sulfur cluster biosynthetic enzyme
METRMNPNETTTSSNDDVANAAESEAPTPEMAKAGDLEARVVDVLRTVFDPEIPVNIYEIGLIYNIDIDESNVVNVRMTLTSPACPVAGSLPGEV